MTLKQDISKKYLKLAVVFMSLSFLFIVSINIFRWNAIFMSFPCFFSAMLSLIFYAMADDEEIFSSQPMGGYVKRVFITLTLSFLLFIVAFFIIGFTYKLLTFSGIVLAGGWGLAAFSIVYIPYKQKDCFKTRRIGINRVAAFLGLFVGFSILLPFSLAPNVLILLFLGLFITVFSLILLISTKMPKLVYFALLLMFSYFALILYPFIGKSEKALFFATLKGDIPRMESLISEGYDMNKEGLYGWTSLHAAINYGYTPRGFINFNKGSREKTKVEKENKIIKMVEILLQNGANIDALDRNGNTPLFYSIINNYFRVTTFLAENGADVNLKNKEDKTPLQIAIENKRTRVIDLLRKYGANE